MPEAAHHYSKQHRVSELRHELGTSKSRLATMERSKYCLDSTEMDLTARIILAWPVRDDSHIEQSPVKTKLSSYFVLRWFLNIF